MALSDEEIQSVFDKLEQFKLANPWYDRTVEIVRRVEEIQRIYERAVEAQRPQQISYTSNSTAPLTQEQYDILVGRK